MLIEFQREKGVIPRADAGEKGAALLKPLLLACGRSVKVTKTLQFTENKRALVITRIVLAIIAILILPFTLIGLICQAASKSHQKLKKAYLLQKPSDLKKYAEWIQKKANIVLPALKIEELINEVFGKKLPKNPYSSAHVKWMLERIDAYKKIGLHRSTPFELAHKKLGNEDPQRLLKDLDAKLQKASHLSSKASLKEKIREVSNIQALRDLEGQLNGATGIDFTKEVMGDWDFIGKEIQDNSAVLDATKKQLILTKAKEAFDRQEEFNTIIDKVKKDFMLDLPPVEAPIFQRYKELAGLLKVMPKSKTEIFKKSLGWAVIHKQIRNPGAFQVKYAEKKVLKSLGFEIEDNFKENVHSQMKDILEDFLKSEDIGDVIPLKEKISEAAFKTKAMTAGVSSENIQNLRHLIDAVNLKMKRDLEIAKKALENQIETLGIDRPLGKRIIGHFLWRKISDFLKGEMWELIEEKKTEILQALSQSPKDFENSIKKVIVELDSKEIEAKVKECQSDRLGGVDIPKAIAWYKKYQDHFVCEFSQGWDDVNEALGGGVCYAAGNRLARQILFFPDEPVEKIRLNSILPSDRWLQASYNISKQKVILPPEILAKLGIKEIILFFARGEENLRAAILDQVGNLRGSNGGIIVNSATHATVMRLDHVRNKYQFIEPNFGTLKFEKATKEETPEELAHRMVDCFLELYEWQNPQAEKPFFLGNQLLKLKPGEKPKAASIQDAKTFG